MGPKKNIKKGPHLILLKKLGKILKIRKNTPKKFGKIVLKNWKFGKIPKNRKNEKNRKNSPENSVEELGKILRI